jgi:hypothetical protein
LKDSVIQRDQPSLTNLLNYSTAIYFKENGLETLAGTIIYVFDWNGEAIKKYELNVPVTLISVDNKDEMLYAFSNMPDPELIRFKIK